jgi:hypothetical protein
MKKRKVKLKGTMTLHLERVVKMSEEEYQEFKSYSRIMRDLYVGELLESRDHKYVSDCHFEDSEVEYE